MASSKRKRARLEKGYYGYIFIAPFFIAYLVFSLMPLINTFRYSLTDKIAYISDFKSVGLDQFKFIIKDENFKQAFQNTPIMWVMGFIPQLGLALLLAAWFTNEKIRVRGQGFFKVIFYMPNIMTAATIGVLFFSFIRQNGFIHNIAIDIGYVEDKRFPITSVNFGRGIIAFINFWMWYGQTMIVLIAGILGINPTFFEAAQIDGASGFQVFRKITLPLIRPIMTYTLVTSLIGGFQMFDVPNMFKTASFGRSTTTMVMYIKDVAYTGSSSIGRASAASVLLFATTAFLSILLFIFTGDRTEKRMKKKMKAAAAMNGGKA